MNAPYQLLSPSCLEVTARTDENPKLIIDSTELQSVPLSSDLHAESSFRDEKHAFRRVLAVCIMFLD